MIILILDIDGVLITTPPWKADTIHIDGYSDFNKSCVNNLNELLSSNNFEIWLSSTRRTKKSLGEFNKIFENRGINAMISGFLPEYPSCANRKEEILSFLDEMRINRYLIIDDDKSLNGLDNDLKENLISTDLSSGFNKVKLDNAIKRLKKQ